MIFKVYSGPSYENLKAGIKLSFGNERKFKISSEKVKSAPVFSTSLIYRRLRIGRDGHLDQFEAYDIS